jgi:Flp pilus assembly protein TadG
MSLQLAVIMVPVLFGMMGFAIDLGRLYLIRGELNQAASAMALAAAAQLVGTSASLGNATTAAQQSLDDSNHLGNKYNFGSLEIGQTTGNLTSTVNPPAYFATVADATGSSGSTGTQADGTTARHVQIGLTADAPLLFWSILPVRQSRKTPIAGQAVAGISAPLCTACGIVPFAVAAPNASDPVNFGFGDPTAGTLYTFAFECIPTPGGPGATTILAPPALVGTVAQYVIINRYDTANATFDETQQLYRDGAQGLTASADPNPTGSPIPLACAGINDASETLWASAVPASCSTVIAPPATVSEAVCGLYSRFNNASPPTVCTTAVTDFADLSTLYQPDTDLITGQADPYINYIGNQRRIITVPIVNALAANPTSTMTVLGFRQFFLEPNGDGSYPNPADPYGRLVVQYIGSPAPVQQGWFDDHFGLGCPCPCPQVRERWCCTNEARA